MNNDNKFGSFLEEAKAAKEMRDALAKHEARDACDGVKVIDIMSRMDHGREIAVIENLVPIFQSQFARMIHTVESMGWNTEMLFALLEEQKQKYEAETFANVPSETMAATDEEIAQLREMLKRPVALPIEE